MSVSSESARKPRIDGQRNRERLLEAAKAGFAETGPDVSLEEIARRADLGIGSLYRHFPTRDALVGAVYRREVEALAATVDGLLIAHPPGEALRRWLHLLVDYVAAKKLIVAALSGPTDELYAGSGQLITASLDRLVAAARTAGDVRPGIEASDLKRLMSGFFAGAAEPGWADSARRLVDVLVDGLAAPNRR
ncbi:TetR family transcriptional regulator [Caulobacter sp. SLTY]|nr:TetR/AcrR family transcriptional regulator [Caulobacter sp. SLTY]NBB15984.1 TetR family transcriptional regulator [Caulobacter sp. SLTY]